MTGQDTIDKKYLAVARATAVLLITFLFVLQLIPSNLVGDGPDSRAQVERPVVYWPMDNLENGTLRPEFIFLANYSGGGGLTYSIEMATDMDFKNVVQTYASNLDGGFTSLEVPDDTQPFQPGKLMAFEPFFDLEPGKVYWWRLRAEAASSPGTTSEWSVPRSLRLNATLVHYVWLQTSPEQLMTGDPTHLDPMTDGVMLGEADVSVFKDPFPSQTINSTNWPHSTGPPTVDDIGSHEPSEPYSLRMNGHSSGSDMLDSKGLDLSMFSNGTLVFHWQSGGGANAPDPGEWLKLEFLDSSSSWQEIFFKDGDGTNMVDFVKEEIDLPPEAFHPDLQLRFVNNAFSAGDDWFVDDIEIRCRNYRYGSLVSVPILYDDGPGRRTGWSTVSFVGSGNMSVAVQSFENGIWDWTGLEGILSGGVGELDISTLGTVPQIRLVANFTEGVIGPTLDSWSVDWARPDSPFVEVLNPQPGEVLQVHGDYLLRWKAVQEDHPLAQNPVSIYFSSNGSDGPFGSVVKGVANTGEYSWKVPDNVSDNCYIKIEVMDDQAVPKVGSDVTDGGFTIMVEPPAVTVLAPNSDEELWAGDHYLIQWWTKAGSFDIGYRSVNVYFSSNGASGDYVPLVEDFEDTGNISWVVPNIDSKACFIKITVRDGQDTPLTAEDISDAQFTVRPDDVSPFVVVSDPPDNKGDFPPEKSISVTFSEEMNKESAELAFSLKPKAKGEFVWYDNTMVFVPSQGLQGGTEYKITVDTSSQDVNGNSLRGRYTSQFNTGAVQESAFEKWTFAILSLFIIGLGIGLGVGGWYLKKKVDEAEALMEPTVIDELFLMSDSGKLIKHYTRRLKPDVDQDILSGMLVAVQNFVKDTFKGEAGQLDELTFGEFKILIARGRYTMIASVVKGPDPAKLKGQLLRCVNEMEKRQKAVVKDWDGDSLNVQKVDPYLRGLIAGKYKD